MILKFADKKLNEYLTEKEEWVKKGRKLSSRIELIDRKIDKSKQRQRKYTEACEPAELIEKGNALEKKINEEIEELAKIGEEIQAIKLAAIPTSEVAQYEALKKEKEEIERDRNKAALRVQKIKDRFIPIIQALVKPHLKEYDDIESAQLKYGVVIVQTFNHLDTWKANYAKKNSAVLANKKPAKESK